MGGSSWGWIMKATDGLKAATFSKVCAPAPTLATTLQTNLLSFPESPACSDLRRAIRGAMAPLHPPAQRLLPPSLPAPGRQVDVRRQRQSQLQNATCHETRGGIGSQKGRDAMLALRLGPYRPRVPAPASATSVSQANMKSGLRAPGGGTSGGLRSRGAGGARIPSGTTT